MRVLVKVVRVLVKVVRLLIEAMRVLAQAVIIGIHSTSRLVFAYSEHAVTNC